MVTGASSGIGEAFARALARRGLNVIVIARREERLAALATELQDTYGIDTLVVVQDLTEREMLPAIEAAVGDREIGLLVNNAGFAAAGDLLDNELAREVGMVDLNVRAPLVLAHRYGRSMRERGRGGIIMVSSTVAFMPVPALSTYAATKAFDLMVAEGLGFELRGTGVDVLALCPGTTDTEFQEKTNTRDLMAMSPERVVEIGLKRLGRRRTVITGWVNVMVAFLTRFTPRPMVTWVSALVMRFMRR